MQAMPAARTTLASPAVTVPSRWRVEAIDAAPDFPVWIAVAEDDAGELLMAVSLGDPSHINAHARRHAARLERHSPTSRAAEQLRAYLLGTRKHFDLRVLPLGSEFERRAWQALTQIPFGETRSYAQQARMLATPGAARAVGRANGRNPVPIIIPCHRVIGSDGSLTGFAGGLHLKRWLLAHEGVRIDDPTSPHVISRDQLALF